MTRKILNYYYNYINNINFFLEKWRWRMNRTLLLVFFILIGLSFNLEAATNKYFPPTASQKHFTAIVNGLPGVVRAEWRSPVSLWVKVSSKAVG